MSTILGYIIKLFLAQLQKYIGRVLKKREIEKRADEKIKAIRNDYRLRRARDAGRSAEDRIRDRLRGRFGDD